MSSSCVLRMRDHPRVGGEKITDETIGTVIQGSPPRRRGKDFLLFHRLFAQRITPAWAGKSFSTSPKSCRAGDHPRVGGEKWLYLDDFFCLAGSPPHRRGKVDLDGGLSEAVGITPAQAGKSKLALCTPSCPTDHPRAGGEKNKELEGVWLPMESPPHGRGKVHFHPVRPGCCGITPAWAGKSKTDIRRLHGTGDHPRVGGEKGSSTTRAGSTAGSPPHGRGKARHLSHGLLPCG